VEKIEEQVKHLLERAMKEPGVAEVMRIYNAQQPAIEVYKRAQQVVGPRWIFSSTTSSSQRVK